MHHHLKEFVLLGVVLSCAAQTFHFEELSPLQKLHKAYLEGKESKTDNVKTPSVTAIEKVNERETKEIENLKEEKEIINGGSVNISATTTKNINKIAIGQKDIGIDNSFQKTMKKETNEEKEVHFTKSNDEYSVLDILYELNDQNKNDEEQEKNKYLSEISNQIHANTANDVLQILQNMYNNPHEYEGNFTFGNYDKVLNNLKVDAWQEMKKLAEQYSGTIIGGSYYEKLSPNEKLQIDMIEKFIKLGDKVNFVQIFGKKVNHDLLEFLIQKFHPLIDKIPFADKISYLFSKNDSQPSPISYMIKSAGLRTLQQFGQYILDSATPKITESEIMQYYHDLKMTNPLSASGLKLLLQLDESDDTRSGRFFNLFGNQNSGYDRLQNRHSDTKYYETKIDPYLLMAGLGAATLLAFVAFRIIVTTMKRRKRDIDEFGLDESDIPQFMTDIYGMIERAENKYDFYDSTENLISSLNAMWDESTQRNGCVCCQFSKYLKHGIYVNYNHINSIIGASVAESLGCTSSGKILDKKLNELLE